MLPWSVESKVEQYFQKNFSAPAVREGWSLPQVRYADLAPAEAARNTRRSFERFEERVDRADGTSDVLVQLARESKAGRFGTFVLFLALGFGLVGFAAKGLIKFFLAGT